MVLLVPPIGPAGCRRRSGQEAARDQLAALLAAGPIRLSAITHDKFRGRIDAAIQLPDGSDAATILRATGHARPPRDGVSGCPVFRGAVGR